MHISSADHFRRWANLLLAPAMWILSSLWLFEPSARSAQGFSNLSENPLVPWGPAFSIWFPIFIGVIAYGIIQWLRSNAGRDIFRQTGWFTAGGFALICGWALITSYFPADLVEWSASLIFVPAMVLLVWAMVKFTKSRQHLDGVEQWLVLAPVSLIAGWCSIAVFIGWNPLVARVTGLEPVTASYVTLGLALIWILLVLRSGGLNRLYAFPPIWGLGFLAYRHFALDGGVSGLGAMAVVGMVALIIAATLRVPTPIDGLETP